MTTRSALALIAVTATAATGTLLLAPATSAKPTTGKDTGIAQVFMVNPVQSSNDQTLTDDKDAASAVPSSAYALAPLRNLDGSGYLRGKWVTVESATGTPAYSRTGEYVYTRDQDQFEQVMGYFWVNQAQEYLQSLGFGSTLPGIIKEPFSVKINQYGGDNSYQTDKPYRIRLGKGGVDDAEDAEVIVHEYGHAVHQSQVPGYGQSADAGAIGESFGDYLAVTVGLAAAAQYSWPVAANPACPMDWDSTSYTDAPHCIRSFAANLQATAVGERPLPQPGLEPGALGDPGRLRQAGQDHGRVGHDADRLAVRLRRRHVVLGGRQGDVRRGPGARRAAGGERGQGPVRRPRHHVLSRRKTSP